MYDLYKCNTNDSSRFILGKNGNKILFIIGLNPSTANKEKSDTTVAKVEKVSIDNGFDGFVMANLYPHRSTDPNSLPATKNNKEFKQNLIHIQELAKLDPAPTFWAAWGGGIALRPYLREAFNKLDEIVKDLGGSWVHYGELRKDGHPRHPSRLSYSWSFSQLDTESYKKCFV